MTRTNKHIPGIGLRKPHPLGNGFLQACFFSFLNKSGKRVNQRFPAELQKKQLTGEKNEFL